MKKEPGSFILIFALAFTALCSGVFLSVVYAGTKPMIQANQAAAIRKAIFQVLPEATSFEIYEVKEGKMVHYEDPEGKMPDGQAIYRGMGKDNTPVGYAVPNKGAGFQDDIKLIFGYQPQIETIVGMRVLESRETPGLGDKIEKDADFVANFDQLVVKPTVVANKKGKRTELNQVDTISGATISSMAVIKIINNSITDFGPVIHDFMESDGEKDTKGGE
ncbi:MAG: hypothetical protein CSA81_03745 [Acidobacteria bacterium]|nr:MAG: hypothetical protein CSA81_03745 [Acidobacteriota bacterium]